MVCKSSLVLFKCFLVHCRFFTQTWCPEIIISPLVPIRSAIPEQVAVPWYSWWYRWSGACTASRRLSLVTWQGLEEQGDWDKSHTWLPSSSGRLLTTESSSNLCNRVYRFVKMTACHLCPNSEPIGQRQHIACYLLRKLGYSRWQCHNQTPLVLATENNKLENNHNSFNVILGRRCQDPW